jgi:hypothetical protein
MNDTHDSDISNAPGDPTQSDTPTRARARQAAFLEALATHGTITKAAAVASIHRSTHYAWLDDPEYAKAFEDAQQTFADAIRDEVRRRAIDGWDEPVFHARNPAGEVPVVRRHSDRLLELLAKAMCPEFREKHEITGDGGGPIKVLAVRYPEKAKSAEEWAARHKPKEVSQGDEGLYFRRD